MSASALALDPPAVATGNRRETKTRARLRLGLMIVLSLLGHAATFYVFQVAYTPSGSLLPPPARVVLVPLDRPENASFARRLALTDPTLAEPTAGTIPGFPGVRYLPSYETAQPSFKPLDSGASTEGIAAPPQPFVPGPVAMNDAPTSKTAAISSTAKATSVVLSGNLLERLSLPLPPVRFADGAGVKPLEPTVFLVGVRPEGSEPFLFPVRQAPAGNVSVNAEEADEFARNYLVSLAFHPAASTENAVVWGKATFYWGDDTRQAHP